MKSLIKPIVSRVTPIVSRRKKPRGADSTPYFCRGQCVVPHMLDQMKYGCQLCSELYLYKDYPYKDILPPQERLDRIWSTQPPCPIHRTLPVIAFCPTCSGRVPINRDDTGRPIGLFAAIKAGKSNVSAGIAHLLLQREFIYKHFGITVQTCFSNNTYQVRNIDPLFQEGKLPEKTRPGDHSKLTFILRNSSNPDNSHILSFTDMSGETLVPTMEVGQEDLELRHSILYCQEIIFLLDPQADRSGIGARTPVELFGILGRLLAIIDRECRVHVTKAAEHVMNSLLEELKDCLQRQLYPDGGKFDDLTRRLVERINGRFGITLAAPVADNIKLALDEGKTIMDSAPSFRRQAEALEEELRSSNQSNGRIDHKVAVAISKADMIRSEAVQNLLLEPAPIVNPKRWKSRREMTRFLDDLSKRSRDVLIQELEQAEFVEWFEQIFSQVHYYFISSLGRGTEELLTKSRLVASAAVPARTHTAPMGVNPAGAQQTAALAPIWELGVRVIKDEEQTRTPHPKGVLYPLLWFMFNR